MNDEFSWTEQLFIASLIGTPLNNKQNGFYLFAEKTGDNMKLFYFCVA